MTWQIVYFGNMSKLESLLYTLRHDLDRFRVNDSYGK